MPLTKDTQDSPLEALNEITNEIAEAGNRATANQLQEIGFELESRLQRVEEERDRFRDELEKIIELAEKYGRLYTDIRFPEHVVLTREAIIQMDTLLADLESTGEDDG